MNSGRVFLAVLNNMAGRDIETAFDRHQQWGLRHLDLKDSIFGKSVEALTKEEAERVKTAANQRDLQIHTLSTCLFHGDIEQGEKAFREQNMTALRNALDVAEVLCPMQIRLLMASSGRRGEILDSSAYLAEHHPWLVGVYQEAVDLIHDAGFKSIIENEVGDCLFTRPTEIVAFFSALNRPSQTGLTWDVQNLWQLGTFPSLAVYDILKSLIRMVHLKGGRAEAPGGALKWRSSLADATWPVLPIVKQVIADGKSPVICINPSHGAASPEYPSSPEGDIAFLRGAIEEIV